MSFDSKITNMFILSTFLMISFCNVYCFERNYSLAAVHSRNVSIMLPASTFRASGWEIQRTSPEDIIKGQSDMSLKGVNEEGAHKRIFHVMKTSILSKNPYVRIFNSTLCDNGVEQNLTMRLSHVKKSFQQESRFKRRSDPSRIKRDASRLKRDASRLKRDASRLQLDASRLQLHQSRINGDVSSLKHFPFRIKRDPSRIKRDPSRLKRDASKLKRDPSRMKRDPSRLKRYSSRLKGGCLIKYWWPNFLHYQYTTYDYFHSGVRTTFWPLRHKIYRQHSPRVYIKYPRLYLYIVLATYFVTALGLTYCFGYMFKAENCFHPRMDFVFTCLLMQCCCCCPQRAARKIAGQYACRNKCEDECNDECAYGQVESYETQYCFSSEGSLW